jgi:protein-disulfide isomerase
MLLRDRATVAPFGRPPWAAQLLALAAVLVALLSPRGALGQVAECDKLSGAQRETAQSVLASEHLYDCCDKTIAACLKEKKVCRLAKRVAADVCRRAAAGQDKAAIVRALEQRALSMDPDAPRASIDLSREFVAGDPNAKVTVVVYLCPRCPFCAVFGPALYKAVTEGALKGKAKLYVKMYPLRSHAGSTEGSMAVKAAGAMGKYFPYLLALYASFDKFNVEKLPELAAAQGLDTARFGELMKDPALRKELVESKKEGVRNQVTSTPAVFINGRKFVSQIRADLVIDALEEEYERVTGKTHD